MSEEKPSIKVTDRRLFNPDGSPRDIEREENSDAAKAPQPSAENTSPRPAPSSSATSQASSGDPNASASTKSSTTASQASTPATNARPSSINADAQGTSPSAATEDPTAFVNLLMFIASPAAAALGLTEHPGLAAGEVDLPLAKHCIDLLGTLRQKTARNLTAQENQVLEDLLAELRMQFVSLSGGRAPSSPLTGSGGFTGSDITGGK
ncbi:MAG: DUF1844 domain-containing protein [Pyrinomonadaceae bacterium]